MPDQISGRVLAVFFWFTLLIVSNIYKGNLIASLATFTPKLPFLTLEEVAADRQYTILMVNDSSQLTLLEVFTIFLNNHEVNNHIGGSSPHISRKVR